MKTEQLKVFYGNLKEEGIFLSYQGPLWQELLEELNDVIKSKISHNKNRGSFHKYLTLFIELVQNIVRYSSEKTEAADGSYISHGVVITGTQNRQNYILAGNIIDPYHKAVLEESLENLKDKKRDELNVMFKKQLRGEIHKQGRGAGLGLIDIYRHADIVEFNFSKTEDERDFFSIKAGFKGT